VTGSWANSEGTNNRCATKASGNQFGILDFGFWIEIMRASELEIRILDIGFGEDTSTPFSLAGNAQAAQCNIGWKSTAEIEGGIR
jgi:hypothetical protein